MASDPPTPSGQPLGVADDRIACYALAAARETPGVVDVVPGLSASVRAAARQLLGAGAGASTGGVDLTVDGMGPHVRLHLVLDSSRPAVTIAEDAQARIVAAVRDHAERDLATTTITITEIKNPTFGLRT